MNLTEFLMARIAEDEAVALQADGHESRVYWDEAIASKAIHRQSVEHYERHDPARVLAECDAKRRIVDLAYLADEEGAQPIYLATLRALALPFADHPDYREEWRP